MILESLVIFWTDLSDAEMKNIKNHGCSKIPCLLKNSEYHTSSYSFCFMDESHSFSNWAYPFSGIIRIFLY